MNLLKNDLYINDIKRVIKCYDFNELNGKTIFITGATGLICSSIIDILLYLCDIGIDIKIIGAGRDVDKIRYRFLDKITPLKYDAIYPVNLCENIDYIIHGAGSASPELYIKKPVETMLSNINGVKNLLQYCVNKNVRMTYISSSEVYGRKDSERQFIENDYGYIDLDNIRNSYSESKRSSEMLCRAYVKEYNVNVSIIRPGHVYGPTASINDKRISSEFSYKAAKGENLEMLSDGLQTRSYCYCIDAACAILITLINGIPGEAYNIGTEEVISIRKMAEILAEVGNVELNGKQATVEETSIFNPMNNSSLSFEKIYNIGFRQEFSAKEGLEHTVEILHQTINSGSLV